ncbi:MULTISPECIES: GGDEF domain-containing protein [unclassified Rhizobium]|uniref:GGDEF domain-containing protein n=1 Tax=unclassified Rhizobium TaxID=2613769 RepID=UPI001FEDA2A3|nr:MULTISPECIES: GGDEF domain-containing protein [unclassified Rhizobium]
MPAQCLSPEIDREVERQLSGRTRDIRFHPSLRRLFRERSWPQTSKIIRAWMIWVIVLDALTLALNAVLLPAEAVRSMLLPASILVPAALVAAAVFSMTRAYWVQGATILTSMFFILLSVALVGVSTGGQFYERHLTIMLFVAVTAIVIFPIPLSWSATIATYAVGIYQLQNPEIAMGSAAAATLFFASGVAATLVARRTATILAQKTFLLELRDRRRLADLTDANNRLELLARTDPLTGVANRRSMVETIGKCWTEAKATRSSIAMLMCDIDEFKKLNDTLGHAEGDRCLVKVAGIIQSSLRSEQDQVARFGGEEFLVLLPNSSEEDARSVAETIRSRVEAAALANPSSRVAPCVTISVGVAAGTVDREAISPDQLQRRADASLYDAKTNGRNQVAVCKDYG